MYAVEVTIMACSFWGRTAAAPALLLAAVLTGCATPAPEVSHDGLRLMPDTRLGAVYIKPGANIGQYQQVLVADCAVSFRKNWLRDQNSQRLDLNNRITREEVDKIKARLGEACREHFREELARSSSFTLVDEAGNGQPTLVLKPSIIDLDINAPDVQRPGTSRSYTTSAGEMTLFLEAFDAGSSAIVARVVDRARDNDSGHLEWTNSVTNRAEANRVLTRWAKQLANALNRAQASTVAP